MTEQKFNRFDQIVAVGLILTSVLPYFAVSIGISTNMPISSLFGAYLLIRWFRDSRILWLSLLTLLAPFFATFLRLFFGGEAWSPATSLTWVLAIIPLSAMVVAVLVLKSALLRWLRVILIFSAGISLVQKYFFLDQGTVPWLWIYDVPGYAPVRLLAPTIAAYIRRPFGLFPEPSFMAGSLSIVAVALILTASSLGRKLRLFDWIALALTCWVIAISGSGTAIVSLLLIVLCIFLPLMKRLGGIIVIILPPVLFAAGVAALGVVNQRQNSVNWSWVDRWSSITAAARYVVSDVQVFFLGIGRGNSSPYFLSGKIRTDDLPHSTVLPDVYSVLLRLVLENGVLFGLPIIIVMALFVILGDPTKLKILGLSALVIWVVAAGLAISYDSAFWLYGFPGLAYGLRRLRQPVDDPNPLSESATQPVAS
ncbi:hypothetical protein FHU41_000822 [Psychromicrobium silvestre]|uniref:O-antigen ligase like membrane protein n=1 Tax=Psychromicrobium silvestre TaxID=1645614 RepID=A0A7Y9LS51_9MICC|nr:hypothetical protein [Psychromicrobium silvestre]NYE94601.1 hypothetical protein [Psychromicrobium silvestre]